MCLHGEGGARSERTRNACHPPATLGYRRPEGSRVDREPSGNAWITREPARRPKQAAHAPETGARASGGGQAPRGGAPHAHAPRGPAPVRDRSPEDCVSTPLRWHKTSISGEKITASVGGAYPRTSPASSELVSGHRTPVTTPSPLAGGAAGPPGRPPKPGSPEDRRGGRGDETLPTATVAGAGRGRRELPRLRTGTWGGGARGNVPPRRLRRTGLQRPTPAGRPAARPLEAGKRGRKSRVGPTGTRRVPPSRSIHLALHVPPPQGPAPVPAAGTGRDTVPREHAHGPGSTSPRPHARAVYGHVSRSGLG